MNNDLKDSSTDYKALPASGKQEPTEANANVNADPTSQQKHHEIEMQPSKSIDADDCSSCVEHVRTAIEHIPDGGLLPAPAEDLEAPILPPAQSSKMGPTATRHVETVQFQILCRGPFKSFKFESPLPEKLAQYITKSEWEELRQTFDDLGQKTKWNGSAGLLLFATVISFCAFWIFFKNHEMPKVISVPVLIALFGAACLFTYQLIYQRRKKEAAMHNIRLACKRYSDQFQKRWIHLEFYESDPKDKFSLYHAQLSFHKTVRLKEPERIPFVMKEQYFEDQD